MKNEILLDDINEFQKQYIKNQDNINIEKKIKKYGIMNASIDNSKCIFK